MKGDSRINRKGRPKQSDTVKSLLAELGKDEVDFNGSRIPKYKAVLLKIIEGAIGGDPQQQKLYLEYFYGKPVQQVELDAKVSAVSIQTDARDRVLLEHFGGGDDGNED